MATDGRNRRAGAILVGVALSGALLTAIAYWPGLMTWDSMREYAEASSGAIDDWHPPSIVWLWGRIARIVAGPAPMLVLQLALYWGGLALLAREVRRRSPRLGWGVLACGFLPLALALMGAILKDSLMAAVLLVATGLLAVRLRRGGAVPLVLAIVALAFAATLRFNAFLACLSLAIALLPRACWSTPIRFVLTVMVTIAALMAAMPLANRLIGATPSGVELSLVIFDLGGITEFSGVSVFPPALAVRDAVRVNHGCYRPGKWDSYADWVKPECPLGYTAWTDQVDPDDVRPYPFWLHAILAHPFAYAEHRLTHFALNTRLLPMPDSVERPVQVQGPPNDWGYSVTANPLLSAIDAAAVGSAHTPLGWPILWIAVAFGALVIGWGRGQALSMPLAWSALLYGGGYLVFSVASELRYHLWTELAALVATVLVAAEWPRVSRRRLALAYAPAVVLLCVGTLLRL